MYHLLKSILFKFTFFDYPQISKSFFYIPLINFPIPPLSLQEVYFRLVFLKNGIVFSALTLWHAENKFICTNSLFVLIVWVIQCDQAWVPNIKPFILPKYFNVVFLTACFSATHYILYDIISILFLADHNVSIYSVERKCIPYPVTQLKYKYLQKADKILKSVQWS